MSRNVLVIAVLSTMLLALAGCGQKGPLYLPGDGEASKTYDPQGDYETSQPASSKQTPGESDSDAQRRQAPQASPAPAATSPTAEELP
ncbi:MAG: lipoprotein [Salinicola sp.]|nr:lipoprotein [Salinicola sp.]NRB57352.1 lipoprotein [Salinicola sp.]